VGGKIENGVGELNQRKNRKLGTGERTGKKKYISGGERKEKRREKKVTKSMIIGVSDQKKEPQVV